MINTIEPLSVTAKQAAELLGFKDIKSIYRLIHEGELKARKAGRIYIISYKSLKNYVEGR